MRYYADYLKSLRCDCASCASEGRVEAGMDCLWCWPYTYARSQGASEDMAAEFHEEVRETGHRLGVIEPTREAWKSFRSTYH